MKLKIIIKNFFLKLSGTNNSFKSLLSLKTSDKVYIIGDGYSLKFVDLSKIQDADIFTISLSPLRNDFKKPLNHNWIAFLTSPQWFYPVMKKSFNNRFWRNRINKIFLNNLKLKNSSALLVSVWSYPLLRNFMNTFYVDDKLFFKGSNIDVFFRSNQYPNYLHGGLRIGISTAISMGYSEIVLVGCDYTSEPQLHGHFFENNILKVTKNATYFEEYFKMISKFIKVYSITLSGQSNHCNIKGLDLYESEFNSKRCNSNLSDDILNNLKTWGDYKI